MKAPVCVTFAALLSGAAVAQSVDGLPMFEISDVHVSHPSAVQFRNGPYLRAGKYDLRYATMVDLVALAYGVDNDKVFGGPSWLEMSYYDIIAKPPAGASKDKIKPMLQALLADRFQLQVHPDSRPMPAFVLGAGKHVALKKSDESGDPGCKFIPPEPPPNGAPLPGPPLLVNACRNLTMAALADRLTAGMPASFIYLNGKPVVDKTGLDGTFDFDLSYTARGFGSRGGTSPSDVTTLFAAVEKLGLKLEAATVPVPGIVVDSVNRAPAPNQPGAAEALFTAIPTEFEVADVKPTDPEFKGGRFDIQAGGRVNLQGISLKDLITQAWNLSNEMLIGAPAWLDSDRWDIVAKAQTVESANPREQGANIDFDAVMVMLQHLLQERFKLAVHSDNRPVEAYTLLPGKPKMRPADPNSRTACNEGPGPDGKDPRNEHPGLSRLVTCTNMTMEVFAGQLQRIAGGYVHVPVLDATKLPGAWDFTLSFSTAGQFQNGARGGRGEGAKEDASEPPDVLSLSEAIARQMGLRFELQKRTAPVLVIDSVERKPTDQ